MFYAFVALCDRTLMRTSHDYTEVILILAFYFMCVCVWCVYKIIEQKIFSNFNIVLPSHGSIYKVCTILSCNRKFTEFFSTQQTTCFSLLSNKKHLRPLLRWIWLLARMANTYFRGWEECTVHGTCTFSIGPKPVVYFFRHWVYRYRGMNENIYAAY